MLAAANWSRINVNDSVLDELVLTDCDLDDDELLLVVAVLNDCEKELSDCELNDWLCVLLDEESLVADVPDVKELKD